MWYKEHGLYVLSDVVCQCVPCVSVVRKNRSSSWLIYSCKLFSFSPFTFLYSLYVSSFSSNACWRLPSDVTRGMKEFRAKRESKVKERRHKLSRCEKRNECVFELLMDLRKEQNRTELASNTSRTIEAASLLFLLLLPLLPFLSLLSFFPCNHFVQVDIQFSCTFVTHCTMT